MQTANLIRLTQTVQKGGCAAKVAALELRKILAQVKMPPQLEGLLIDSETFDDAAIMQVNSELALVQTLDFFTPIVDTPKIFGRIAAANALSDVYAMGGQPMTAMAIMAFPLMTLDNSVAVDVLQGASDCIGEAGASLVGGHTIDDDTLKFGLSVTGFVHPEKIWSNAGAKPGDVLILTKALGTGTLTAALKRGEVSEADISDALTSMGQLNNVNKYLAPECQRAIHAATDITGFGLAGHALNMARASGVDLEFQFKQLPSFKNTMAFLAKGFLTKAHRTNKEYATQAIKNLKLDSVEELLLFDPQTSGGILLAIAPEFADQTLAQMQKQFQRAQKVGVVTASSQTPGLSFL